MNNSSLRLNLLTLATIALIGWVAYDIFIARPQSAELLKQASVEAKAAQQSAELAHNKISAALRSQAAMFINLGTLKEENKALMAKNNLTERRYETLLITRRKRLHTYLDSARKELESLQKLQDQLK